MPETDMKASKRYMKKQYGLEVEKVLNIAERTVDLSKNNPPGAAPHPGMIWNPTTRRWRKPRVAGK